jgi:hypothetical protein
MAINQLSTANTFEQWLIATQILIEQSNFYEDRSNLVLEFANTVDNIYPVFLNTSNDVFTTANAVFDTANVIFDYVGESFDVANTVLAISLESFDHINAAYNHANTGYDHANGSFDTANVSFNHANGAFNTANVSFNHANGAFDTANLAAVTSNTSLDLSNLAFGVANSFFPYLANNANLALLTEDTTTDNDAFYVLFTQNEGVLVEGHIAKNKLYYNPASGTISAVSAIFTGNSHITIPAGDESERPANAVSGMIRYNNEANTFEGYTSFWGPIAGGATGAPNNPVFWENDQTVTGDYTISINKNAGTFGPVTIADGVTVTVPSGSVWTIV